MMPDKIYFPADGLPSYIDWDGSPIRTKQVFPDDVCYIRKDALLEWLSDMKFMANSERAGAYQNVIDKLNEM